MNKHMESLVNECLLQHIGGEKFFDELDYKLRNDNSLITMMIGKILENETFDYIIVSGKFGKVFKSYCKKHMNKDFYNNIINVKGGLRKGYKIDEFWNKYDIKNKRIIFIDDSYYLGRTKDKIKDTINSHGGIFINTYVFYDGSKVKDNNVNSFYRYYDHYPSE